MQQPGATEFQTHALMDVWMCGIVFCELIQKDGLEEKPHLWCEHKCNWEAARDQLLLPADEWAEYCPPVFKSDMDMGLTDDAKNWCGAFSYVSCIVGFYPTRSQLYVHA